MFRFSKVFLLALLCNLCVSAFALKPKWVGNTPKAQNNTYRFIEIISKGNSLDGARLDAKQQLAKNEQLRKAVLVKVDEKQNKNIDQKRVNGNLSETINEKTTINTEINGKLYRLQCIVVDEYVESERPYVVMHTLFMVAVTDNPVFDHAYLTTSYGAAPIFMSIIPGLGQIYKGSTLKGIALFAGTAACAGGALICENLRSDYKNKMREQPQFAQKYNTKANNCQTARNICLGAAAAVWIYNIIDAAAAKGARKVEVRRSGGVSTAFAPMITPDGAGLTLAVNF